jgi:hypothetical protein
MYDRTRCSGNAQVALPFALASLHVGLASQLHFNRKAPREREPDRDPGDQEPRTVGRRSGARASLCGLLLVGIGGLVLAQPWLKPAGSHEAPTRQDCVAWDRATSEGIAELVFDSSATAEWKLDQAILQLRRARKHCRSGSVQAALRDYASLHRSLPFVTGSTRVPAQNGAGTPPEAANELMHRASALESPQ